MTDTVSPVTADAAPSSVVDHDVDLKAENLIKNHVMAASAASIVPLPLFDVAAITLVQVRMIAKLAKMFDKTFSEKSARNTIAALGGGVVGHAGGVVTAISLTKLVPGIGWMVGMVSLPTVAGASTYAIGRVFARHFKQGGSVTDVGTEDARGYYDEQLDKGKKLAANIKESIHTRTAPRDQPA